MSNHCQTRDVFSVRDVWSNRGMSKFKTRCWEISFILGLVISARGAWAQGYVEATGSATNPSPSVSIDVHLSLELLQSRLVYQDFVFITGGPGEGCYKRNPSQELEIGKYIGIQCVDSRGVVFDVNHEVPLYATGFQGFPDNRRMSEPGEEIRDVSGNVIHSTDPFPIDTYL